MHLKFRNVNTAFEGLVRGIHERSIPTVEKDSRNGKVLMVDEPIIVTYEKPRERVLFNEVRDANPFFHLFESLWMLSGRNDVAPLKEFVSTIDNFSDDGETFNGAYGSRWKYADKWLLDEEGNYCCADTDQLKVIIKHLKKNPTSRRAVLQMWNVEDDLLKIDSSKDVCCNTAAYFSLREIGKKCHRCSKDTLDSEGFIIHTGECNRHNFPPLKESMYALDMTVTNRSNDLIWGMLGANAVHFSFLQEYVANCLGVQVGVYNQMSNNLHIYTENNSGWKPEEWLNCEKIDYNETLKPSFNLVGISQDNFDREVKKFIDNPQGDFSEPFLENIAVPVVSAYKMHKSGDSMTAMSICDEIKSGDWKVACFNWIKRRMK